jgi:regulator of replication initiation timing
VNIMRQDLEMIEQKLKTLINLLAELQIENKLLKEKTSQQDESIKQLNTKIHEASQKIENLLGQIPDEELL